ncbi:MAG TPA: hypothetical protein VK601_10325 [Kofleriaceae bacterium]|nr:hypothetical protein [Kofleriaceae bacterium]
MQIVARIRHRADGSRKACEPESVGSATIVADRSGTAHGNCG